MVDETRPDQRLSRVLGYVVDDFAQQLAASPAESSIYAVEVAGRRRAFTPDPNLAP